MSNNPHGSPLNLAVYQDEVWGTAPCTQVSDPDIMFSYDKSMSTEQLNELRLALQLCDGCPLKAECLELGMQGEDIYWGIWGGLFPAERKALKGWGHQRSVRTGLSAIKNLRARLNNLPLKD